MKQAKKLEVIECSGTGAEIGRQYGEACRDSLKKALAKNLGAIETAYQLNRKDIIANALKFLPKAEVFDPYLFEMLKGQAQGSGLSFEEFFALRCMLELVIYQNQIAGLCTSFAVSGESTRDGKTILGQNIDWSPDTSLNLLKIHHDGGPSQLVLSLDGFVEYTLSSAGFGMCANATFGREYAFTLPLGCYLPKVMRQPGINEAREILEEVARGLGYYQLADTEGNIFGIESTHNDFELLYPDRGILVHANHYLTERFKEQDTVEFSIPDSLHRVVRMKKLTEELRGNLTPQLMMELLADHHEYPNSICRHPDPAKPPFLQSETLGSFVMVPEDRVIYIACGNPCQYTYEAYYL